MTITIQDSNAFRTEVFSTEGVNDLGETKLSKNNSVENSSAHMAALITLAFKKVAGIEENKTGGPSLRPPVGKINDAQWAEFASVLGGIFADPELENKAAKIQANPALVKKDEALRTQATALSGDAPRADAAGFNIMNISSQPADLLIAFLLLMLQSRVAAAGFNSKMTSNNADAVKATAKSIMNEGVSHTLGGVFGGLITIAGGAIGTGLKATAQIKSRQNQQNVLNPMKDRQAEAKTLNDLNGAKGSVKSADELKVAVKAPDGSDKAVRVAPSDTELSAENEAKIGNTINAKNEILNRGDALANEANQKTIDHLNTTGELFSVGSGIGGLITAGVQVDIKADQAEQQIDGLNARVASQGGDDALQQAKALIALIAELLQSMVAFYQSRNGAFNAVAQKI